MQVEGLRVLLFAPGELGRREGNPEKLEAQEDALVEAIERAGGESVSDEQKQAHCGNDPA